MPEDFGQMLRNVLDAEQQCKENIERVNQEISATKFHDTFTPDFEKFQAIEQAQNQAPLDIVAELNAINKRLATEHDERMKSENEQKHIDQVRFWITFVVTLIGSLAAVGSLIATIVLS